MTLYHRSSDRKRIFHMYTQEEEEENGSSFCSEGRPITAKNLHEHEKRIRREIANSNERRRMQNINAGLQSLKSLLPHREGEKLSKVAILQSAAEYVYQLEQDKKRLMKQNSQMSKNVTDSPNGNHDSDDSSDSSMPKRKRRKTIDSADEGIGSSSSSRSDHNLDDYKQEIQELRTELKHERDLRLVLEEQIRNLESRIFQMKTKPNHAGETVQRSVLVMNYGHESGISSPQSPISSQDTESANEMSSPDYSGSEENPSKKDSIPSAEHSTIVTTNNPGLLMPASPMNTSPFPVTPQQPVYNMSRSRQNLDTIVEAIKHVEGLNVFHSDTIKSDLF